MLSKRDIAAKYVASNWRVRKRLPRVTAHAYSMGLINESKQSLGDTNMSDAEKKMTADWKLVTKTEYIATVKEEVIKQELSEAGYDFAVAIATEAEVKAGAACGQLAIINEA